METLISLSSLQAANVSNLRDSGRTFHLPPMTVQAELCELAFWQVTGRSSRSVGCFPESLSGGSWPGRAKVGFNLVAANRSSGG